MKKDTFGAILIVYLRDRWKAVLAVLMTAAIFLVVSFLYNVDKEPVRYASILLAAVMAAFCAWDFSSFWRRHKSLLNCKNNIAVTLGNLPDARSLVDEDYQELLRILFANQTELISQADSSRTDLIEYYTLWAHQIKTPIAAMRLLLQSQPEMEADETGEGYDGDEWKKTHDALSQELFKIEQYVEMVLQYLRAEELSGDLQLRQYYLDEIIKQAVKKYAAVFIHKRISLRYESVQSMVVTDERWLVFVIEQLLSNALKYTGEGSISIYMEPGAEKTLVIEDTGIGIDPEDVPRIFEKGFTGYNGRMDKRSTGIGLYLCSKIMNKLSHGIEITSTPGAGTKVFLNLASVKLNLE